MNPDKIKDLIYLDLYSMFVAADPVQSLKNSSTGLKLTNFQLDLVEESRDQVKLKPE